MASPLRGGPVRAPGRAAEVFMNHSAEEHHVEAPEAAIAPAARNQVLVLKKRSDALPVTNGDPRLSFYEDYVSTHLVLIRSPLVVERAVKKRNLGSLKSFEKAGDPAGAIMGG